MKQSKTELQDLSVLVDKPERKIYVVTQIKV
jgi:hypothetical protein